MALRLPLSASPWLEAMRFALRSRGLRRECRRALVGVVVATLLGPLYGCQDKSSANNQDGASKIASNMGPLEIGTNRPGRDFSDFGVRARDAAECSQWCAEDDRCLAMSFLARPPPSDGICWLKGSVPAATANPAMVSAVKSRPPN